MINICIEVINERGQLIDEFCVGIRRNTSVNKYKIIDFESEDSRDFNFEIEAVLSNEYILLVELVEDARSNLNSEFDINLDHQKSTHHYSISLKKDYCILNCFGFENVIREYL